MAVFDWAAARCHEQCWCSQGVRPLSHLESWAPVPSPCLWAGTLSTARVSRHLPQAWERDAAPVGASQRVDLAEGAQTAPAQVARRPVPQFGRLPAPAQRVAPEERPHWVFRLAPLEGLQHLPRQLEFQRSPRFRVGRASPIRLQSRQRVSPLPLFCASARETGRSLAIEWRSLRSSRHAPQSTPAGW